ncbi:MAG: ribonuclease P protein component [Thermoleophilaceae bacterium]|nr:ribonuclease P protein component [Thermoleophilaceae bacterium]
MGVIAPPGASRRGGRRRLSRSADFDRVFREGRSFGTRHLVLHTLPRAGDGGAPPASSEESALPRLGVSVGRRVGGAVERNRVKRLLREAFWAVAAELPSADDYVLVARPEASELARRGGEPAFEGELRELVVRSGLAG